MPDDIIDDVKSPMTQNDILAELADDLTDDEPIAEEEIPEDKEPEEEPSEEDDEIELKDEPAEDDLEYVDIPARQEILKAYPDIFKKFPGIDRAIQRERQYDKLFGTIKEAETAKETVENFNSFQSELFGGNLDVILNEVKKADPNAFNKIADNFLVTLQKVDQPAYFNTVNHVIRHAISAAFEHGKAMGDEDGEQLQLAARLLNKFIYNSTQVTRPEAKAQVNQEDPKAKELSERERAFNERLLKTAVDDVTSRINGTIKSAVDKYIDPKQLMSGYVRTKAVADAIELVTREIKSDDRFNAHLDRLWAAAMQSGYTDESKSRIRQAVINRAKSILPGAIKKVRADAVKGSSSVPRKKKEEVQPETPRRSAAPSNNRSSSEKIGRGLNSVSSVMKALE